MQKERDVALITQELNSSPTKMAGERSVNTDNTDVVYMGSNMEPEMTTTLSHLSLETFLMWIIKFWMTHYIIDDIIAHSEQIKRILVVHHGHVLPELIAHFLDESVLGCEIKPCGAMMKEE